jgi:hypothetical protein
VRRARGFLAGCLLLVAVARWQWALDRQPVWAAGPLIGHVEAPEPEPPWYLRPMWCAGCDAALLPLGPELAGASDVSAVLCQACADAATET